MRPVALNRAELARDPRGRRPDAAEPAVPVSLDWRTGGAGYPNAGASLLVFAWEFLRRNAHYRAAWDRLPATDLAVASGLRVPRDPDAATAPPAEAWEDGWSPRPRLLGLAAFDGVGDGARARVLAEMRAETRAAEFRRLVARLGPLRVGNRARLLLQLRAWDGRAAGATDPELAMALFPGRADAHRYPYSSARRRARHAWQEAERFIAGRYRLLALAELTN